jgi:hypothetical protein
MADSGNTPSVPVYSLIAGQRAPIGVAALKKLNSLTFTNADDRGGTRKERKRRRSPASIKARQGLLVLKITANVRRVPAWIERPPISMRGSRSGRGLSRTRTLAAPRPDPYRTWYKHGKNDPRRSFRKAGPLIRNRRQSGRRLGQCFVTKTFPRLPARASDIDSAQFDHRAPCQLGWLLYVAPARSGWTISER